MIADDRGGGTCNIILCERTTRAIDGFASMLVYDLNLNPIGKILPRANDKSLPLFNNMYQTVGEGPDRIFYWEPYFDTLYTINPDHSTEATHIIGWSKNGPSFDYMSTFTYNLPPDQQYPINFIYSISETEKYFFIGGVSKDARFTAAYNKKQEQRFSQDVAEERFVRTNCQIGIMLPAKITT